MRIIILEDRLFHSEQRADEEVINLRGLRLSSIQRGDWTIYRYRFESDLNPERIETLVRLIDNSDFPLLVIYLGLGKGYLEFLSEVVSVLSVIELPSADSDPLFYGQRSSGLNEWIESLGSLGSLESGVVISTSSPVSTSLIERGRLIDRSIRMVDSFTATFYWLMARLGISYYLSILSTDSERLNKIEDRIIDSPNFDRIRPSSIQERIHDLQSENNNLRLLLDQNTKITTQVFDEVTRREELENLRDLRDNERCKICFSSPVNTVIDPCGHAVMCLECYSKLNPQECSICRVKLIKVISIRYP